MNKSQSEIFRELMHELPVPDRLSPENITLLLEKQKLKSASTDARICYEQDLHGVRKIEFSSNEPNKDNSQKSRAGSSGFSKAYRITASLAACLAILAGVVVYTDVSHSEITSEDPSSSDNYANDYSELFKTFQRFYIDGSDKKTLDSASAEASRYWGDSEDVDTDNVSVPHTGTTSGITATMPSDSGAESEEPDVPPADESEVPEENKEPEAEPEQIVVLEPGTAISDKLICTDGNTVFYASGDNINIAVLENQNVYLKSQIPLVLESSTKRSFEYLFLSGSRLVAVSSVTRTEKALSNEADFGTLGEFMVNTFGDSENGIVERHSTEVKVYDVSSPEIPVLVSSYEQSGSCTDAVMDGSILYIATSYDKYRYSPISGVDDLESYVPSYAFNGQKYYLSAQDIIIPNQLATTDYAVLAGLDVSSANPVVSAKAVLGYEGRIYIFGGSAYMLTYSNGSSTDMTSISQFSLSGGNIGYVASASVPGIALKEYSLGKTGDYVYICTLVQNGESSAPNIFVLDSSLMVVSSTEIAVPSSSVKSVTFSGSTAYISVAGKNECYTVDLSDPYFIKMNDGVSESNTSVSFKPSGDGTGFYLRKNIDSTIELVLCSVDSRGVISQISSVEVEENPGTSTALNDAGVLFTDASLKIVGVPYSYYDGYDYCYKYIVFSYENNVLSKIGSFETHEIDNKFEYGRAVYTGESLCVISPGRITSAHVDRSGVSVVSEADTIANGYTSSH